ncbi:hypothetical protein BH09ACT1_BH09ACT1_05810 [soil metagenome]
MSRTTASWLRLVPIWLLLVVSVISWRRGVLFDGGTDPVVLTKAFLSLVALGLAVIFAHLSPVKRRIGMTPIFAILFIVAISTLGALDKGNVSAAAVLAARILIVVGIVIFVVRAFDSTVIVASLLTSMGAVGAFAAVTGLSSFLDGGRLFGGIPPLQPNELTALVIAPFVGAFFALVYFGIRFWNLVAVLGLGFIIYASGSRTGLLVAVIAVVLVLVLSPRVPRPLGYGIIIFVPIAYGIATFTGLIENLALRGGNTSDLLTLNSRTNAWDVVLGIPDNTWQRWIGAGLDVKTVQVTGQYWKNQVLDSSWISSLAQSGVIGTVVLAGLVLYVFFRATGSHPLRPLFVSLIVLTAIRSFLENGLVESSVTFILFFTLALVLDQGTGTLAAPVRIDPWSREARAAGPRRIPTPSAWVNREKSPRVSAPVP